MLAGTATALTASAGCLQRLSGATETQSEALTVEILTPPGDADPFAVPIARALSEWFERAGIDTRLTPLRPAELYRRIQLGHDFDSYVGRFPFGHSLDPDALYPLLGGRFGNEFGWQNPFGFSVPAVDETLTEQRRTTGEQRQTAVETVQTQLGDHQPFVPLVRPTVISAVRTDGFAGWETALRTMPEGLLTVTSDSETAELRLGTTDNRLEENRNPISPTHRTSDSLLGLVYDPLVRQLESDSGEQSALPWLADQIEWNGEDELTADIRLRPSATFHDGTALTSEDVVFTYEFLADTARGGAATPVPAPRFRGASTLVETVTARDTNTVSIEFGHTSQSVATNALTVPILPADEWREQTETVDFAGDGLTTDALFWDTPEPVGSGPLRFVEVTADNTVRFRRFEDHFLFETSRTERESMPGPPAFESLAVESHTSDRTLVEAMELGDIDATIAPLGPDQLDRIEQSSTLTVVTQPSARSYHFGFNCRIAPFTDPNFRQLVARLIDKTAVVETVFSGYGEPIASPLAGTDWLAPEFEWDGTDPAAPFFGSDGVLDSDAARSAFQDAGYRYTDDDELVL